MNGIRAKVARLRLDAVSYEYLRLQVLRRDGWRCQSCGAMLNLEVHHQRFRSHSGADSELNLITLCGACHSQAHRKREFKHCPGQETRASEFGRSDG